MATITSQNSALLKCFVTIPLLKYFSCTVGVLAYSANVPRIKIISITAEKKTTTTCRECCFRRCIVWEKDRYYLIGFASLRMCSRNSKFSYTDDFTNSTPVSVDNHCLKNLGKSYHYRGHCVKGAGFYRDCGAVSVGVETNFWF